MQSLCLGQNRKKWEEKRKTRKKNVHEDVNINRNIDQTQKGAKMLASLT